MVRDRAVIGVSWMSFSKGASTWRPIASSEMKRKATIAVMSGSMVHSLPDAPDARATETPRTPAPPADAQNPDEDGSGGGPSGNGTEGLPGWPIESTPVHGAELWAAYVAVGAPGDPGLQQVLERVRQGWPGAGLGELGCDEGAAAALGRTPTEHAVAVYFATEQHITEFLRRWEAPFVGAVLVTTMCAD